MRLRNESYKKISAALNRTISNIFDKLYQNQNINEFIVARLEIAYLPYFRHDGNPKCLVRYLQANPKEYVLFISKCYKPDEPSEEVVIDEAHQVQAHTAYAVLDLFKSIPGYNESSISSDIFYSWVSEAREYASILGFNIAFGSAPQY